MQEMKRKADQKNEMPEEDKTNILKRAILEKNSPVFLSKNIKKIKQYLWQNGKDVSENEIKSYLTTQKSHSQINSNISRRKIAEVGKSFNNAQQYGRNWHTDIIVLSSNRKYNSRKRLILTLVESLSNYVYLELINDSKAETVIKAFDRMFARCKFVAKGWKTLIGDLGSEYRNNKVKEWAKLNSVKISLVKYRPERGSKGSGKAEVQNKRIRRILESIVLEKPELSMEEKIKLCEETLNSEKQSVLENMSANTVVFSQDPRYIAMVHESQKLSTRKYLREAVFKGKKLKMYDIVRVKVTNAKHIWKKESYGSFSI